MNYNNSVYNSSYVPLPQPTNNIVLPKTDEFEAKTFEYWSSDSRNPASNQNLLNKVAKSTRSNKMKFSNIQQETLIQEFEKEMFPSKERVYELVEKVGISYNILKLWYRNRRARIKKQCGGAELLENAKAKHLQLQNSTKFRIKQEPIDSNSKISVIAQEIRSKSESFNNISLRDLLNQAPVVPQLRPSSTLSSDSLCSDSASDSADSSNAEYLPNGFYKDAVFKKEVISSADYFSNYHATCPVVNSVAQLERGQGKVLQMQNNVNLNQHSNSITSRNNLISNNLNPYYNVRNLISYPLNENSNSKISVQRFPQSKPINSSVSQSPYYYSTPTASLQKNYSHNVKAAEQNYTRNGTNPRFNFTNTTDYKYYTKQSDIIKETNIQVQSVLVLPAIQQRQNYEAHDKYSLDSNLTSQDLNLILRCNPLEQRKGFVQLLNLLEELHSRTCDCSKCT